MATKKNSLLEAASDLAKAKERMSDDEFNIYAVNLAVVTLGCIFHSQGKDFYDGFLQGAIENPIPIELKKAPLQ